MSIRTDRTPEIWILHRDAAKRAALARMIAAGPAARNGSPTDIEFETADAPRAVVLGLGREIELELEFVHRNSARLAGCCWLLVTDDTQEAEWAEPSGLVELFDTVDACVLTAPHSGAQLREAIRQALGSGVNQEPLSLRRYRDRLGERFVRWFDDVGVDALLRAMDPKLAAVPLVLRGEPGSGRSLFARYVHTFGGDAFGGAAPFVEIDCASARDELDLLSPIANAVGAASATLLLEGLEQLRPSLRSGLVEWIDYGLPPGIASGTRLRWAAALPPAGSVPDAAPEVLAALAGLTISIAPLRERPEAIVPFALATARTWSRAAGRSPRDFTPDALHALDRHGWPGNLRELEGVLLRALAEHSDDPLKASHFRIQPDGALEPWSSEGPSDAAEATPRDPQTEEAEETAGDPPTSEPKEDEILILSEADALDPPSVENIPSKSTDRPVAPPELPEADFVDDEDLPLAEFVEEESELPTAEFVVEEPDVLAPAEYVEESEEDDFDDEFEDEGDDEVYDGQLLDDGAEDAVAPAEFVEGDSVDEPAARDQDSEMPTIELRDTDRLEPDTPPPLLEPVDTTALIESQLASLRSEVARRNLLVLKELDREHPIALANAVDLRLGLRALLSQLVMRSEEQGEFYIASHYNPTGLDGQPSLRLLIRQFSNGQSTGSATAASLSPELRVELTRCERLTEAAGGRFAQSEGSAGEVVVMFDLPAPTGD